MRRPATDASSHHSTQEGGDNATKTYLNLAAFEADLNGGDLSFVGGLGAVGLTTLYCVVRNQSAGTYEVARVTL